RVDRSVSEGAAPGYSWYSPPGFCPRGDVASLCCLEGSTMSNRVHRNEVKVCSDRTNHLTPLPGRQYARGREIPHMIGTAFQADVGREDAL
ncbi:MAG: hypothetical protein ACI4B5_09135, partial [Bacteroidaceae bacterium]